MTATTVATKDTTVAAIAAEGAAYLPIHDSLQAAGVPTLSRYVTDL